jgi:hypothetical protein
MAGTASTQNQARNAILFLHRDVLKIKLPYLEDVQASEEVAAAAGSADAPGRASHARSAGRHDGTEQNWGLFLSLVPIGVADQQEAVGDQRVLPAPAVDLTRNRARDRVRLVLPIMTQRIFESNTQAFEFACEHLDCSLRDGQPVLGVVPAVQGRMCSVKIAHREDKTVPHGTLSELLSRSDLLNVCFSAMLAEKVPQLHVDDLILYTTMPELVAANKPTVAGTIIAKVMPRYSTKGGWQVEAVQPPAAPGSNHSN